MVVCKQYFFICSFDGKQNDSSFIMQQHEKGFPKLTKLALDFLCCVGSSCAFKRAFSTAAIVCSNQRGGLTSRSIERAVGICQWLKQWFAPSGELGHALAAVEQLVVGLAKKKNVAKVQNLVKNVSFMNLLFYLVFHLRSSIFHSDFWSLLFMSLSSHLSCVLLFFHCQVVDL